MDSNTLLIILLVILVLGGSGFYRRGRWVYLPGIAFGAR